MDKVTTYLQERYPHISFRQTWDISSDTCFKLGQCNSIIQSLSYLPLAPEVRQTLLNVSMIKGAQATTAIEGNTLSEEEIQRIKNGGTLSGSQKYLETEVKNVIDALNCVFTEVVHENRAALVTPQLIRNMHRMVGQNLGEAFNSIPGQFRKNEVVVGLYRAPDCKYVQEIMDRFCSWLHSEFSFDCQGSQIFTSCVVEAVVAHVYLAWIHPFGDGNGRTARLLEFYLLLRGGLPNICSHILSNHYNKTRSEYYRQLDAAKRDRSLTKFLEYAVQGMLDGLNEVLWQAQRHQLNTAWTNYVYEVLDSKTSLNRTKRKRLCKMLTTMDILGKYTCKTIVGTSVSVGVAYADISPRSVLRDLSFLVQEGLLLKEEGLYCANIRSLVSRLPESRSPTQHV